MSDHKPNQPCILYLDQFVLADVTNSKSKNAKFYLGKIINIGVKIGALICPFSEEHLWETSAIRDEEKQLIQLNWLSDVSLGACFMNRESLVALQLIEIVRPYISQETNFLYKVDLIENKKVLGNMSKLWKKRRDITEKYYSDYNQRRAKGKTLRKIPNELLHAQKIDKFYHGIADCIAHHIVKKGEYDTAMYQILDERPFGAKVLKKLLETYKVTAQELSTILDKVIATRGHCSPLIHVQSKLYESWMLEQKEILPADIFDLERISTVLPYTQILVVDYEQSRHLDTTELAKKYGTKVFTFKTDSVEPLFLEIMRHINRRLDYLNKHEK